MANYQLKLSEVKPTWFKLLILIFIGLPPFTGWPLSRFMSGNYAVHNISVWTAYGVFIWLFTGLNVGGKQLLKYLSVAFTASLLILMLTGVFSHIPFLNPEKPADESLALSYTSAMTFVIMIAVIPYGLFAINCFSASAYVQTLQFQSGKRFKFKVHLALALRVCQHVGDVLMKLFDIWREENPRLIRPRFATDLNESKLSFIGYILWFKNAVVTWCFALLSHTFEAIPYFSEEMRIVINHKHQKIK